jgi:hypothetical protein
VNYLLFVGCLHPESKIPNHRLARRPLGSAEGAWGNFVALLDTSAAVRTSHSEARLSTVVNSHLLKSPHHMIGRSHAVQPVTLAYQILSSPSEGASKVMVLKGTERLTSAGDVSLDGGMQDLLFLTPFLSSGRSRYTVPVVCQTYAPEVEDSTPVALDWAPLCRLLVTFVIHAGR